MSRPAISFSRRNERRPQWGDPLPRRFDWGLVAFIILWTAAMSAVAVIGAMR